jgi:hypothetical protein
MISDSLWIFGTSRSGKTTRLVNQFSAWLQIDSPVPDLFYNKNIHNSQPQPMSVQLPMFEEQTFQESTSSLLEVLAKISHWQENERGWKDKEVLLSSKQSVLLANADQVYLSGKMLKGHSPQMMAQTFGRLSKPLPTLGAIDLNGNCLIQFGFYPKIESGYILSDILMEEVAPEYFLSQKTISGLLKGYQKPQLLEPFQQEDTAEECTAECPL